MQPDYTSLILSQFTAKYDINPDAGCWDWISTLQSGRYPVFFSRHYYPAHRFAYKAFIAPIPSGMTLTRLCGNHLCVNPDHMKIIELRGNGRGAVLHDALEARGTCAQGHPLSEYVTYNGIRSCPACNRDRVRARYQRKKAATSDA